jgi:aspartyl-tRNA synthetase
VLRTHNSDCLDKHLAGQNVTLAGWVDRRRDHGGLIFIDVRDRYGLVQVVFNPEINPDCHRLAQELRSEFVIQVSGSVSLRPAGTENPKLATGGIEVLARELKILNTSETPPFYINEDSEVDENLRLKYRYLDMRRARLRDNIMLRHQTVRFIRAFLDELDFIEIETPILTKSTPEGARDYLVPSRVHAGKFYALPQSPQQMKQLLMVGGLEKYYQIAKCFRDEDTRADRQPEFTQLDVEMSFVTEEDVISLTEALFSRMVTALRPEVKIPRPFPRLSYAEAMERYGSDKPDLRFGLEIRDVSDIVAGCGFAVLSSTVAAGGRVKGIVLPGCAHYTRTEIADLTQMAQGFGAKGLLPMAFAAEAPSLPELTMERVKSVAAKYLTLEQIKEMAARSEAGPGDLLLLVAGDNKMVTNVLGRMRQELGLRLGLADPSAFAFAFITDFPLFEWNTEAGRWQAVHHPFTSPVEADLSLLESAPEKVQSRAYDIVLNGYEMGGGSIRIHQSALQRRVFKVMGYTDSEVDERFGHLLEAFSYGAPPHGGIALGIDRVVMLLAGEDSIREVIPFPKNQSAVDMLFDAPATVAAEQLKELHIRLCQE